LDYHGKSDGVTEEKVMAVVALEIAKGLRIGRGRHRHPKRRLPKAFHGRVIAHRGLHFDAPENSLSALIAGAQAGLPVEFDVRLTGDEKLVVCHDPWTNDVADKEMVIADSTLAELMTARLVHKGRVLNESIASLDDVLEAVDTPLVLEIKKEDTLPSSVVERVLDVLERFDIDAERLVIESFNPMALAQVRKRRPDISRVQLVSPLRSTPMAAYKRWLLRHLMLNGHSKPDVIGFDIDMLTDKRVGQVKERLGYGLFAWTSTDFNLTEELFQWGVDAVIADLTPKGLAHAQATGHAPA
jgi:glycerophosphoryl diester phosphodiesterase